MESKRYTVPVEQVAQQIERLRIPRGYLVEFSYRRPEPAKKDTNAKNNLPSQLAGVVNYIESTGGLSDASIRSMKGHFKEFKESFDL